MPTIFRTILHNQRVEVRRGDFGGLEVLVNGRVVSSRPFASWTTRPYIIPLTDEAGHERAVELQVVSAKMGFSMALVILVDGQVRARLMPERLVHKPEVCANCGHPVVGLKAVNGEVQCPECGRHTPAGPASTTDR